MGFFCAVYDFAEKQILARAIGIQKKKKKQIGGSHAFFRDN